MESLLGSVVSPAAFIVLVCAVLGSAWWALGLRRQNVRLTTAMNNMSQGLLMFDGGSRVLLCNDQYVQMYALSRSVVKPGATLEELIRHRVQTGGLRIDPKKYMESILATKAAGKKKIEIIEPGDGRSICCVTTPMADGGWVV